MGCSPPRIVVLDLSPDETLRVSEALGPECAILASEARGAAPEWAEADLVVTSAAGAEGLLQDASAAAAPPLLILYDPADGRQVGLVARLARRHAVQVLARDGDLSLELPLAARAALAAGRLHGERVAELEEARHRLECVLECVTEGLLILGQQYRFASINPVARELLGVASLEELSRKLQSGEVDPGLHPIFWLHAHGEDASPCRCWQVLQCGREDCPAHGVGLFPCWLYHGTMCGSGALGSFPEKLARCRECPVYRANARVDDPAEARGQREMEVEGPPKKVLESRSAPIVDEAGRFLGVVKLLRDVTADRLLQRLRAEFAALMTHEMRTPLTSISGFLTLVLAGHSGPLTDIQRRQLAAAQRQSRRLEGLVDNLLDISAIDAGRLPLHLSRFDLAATIIEGVENLRPQAEERGVTLRVQPLDDVLLVLGDRDRIMQVLTNLLGNAIKYTHAGGSASVGARVDGGEALVEVADTGIGIAPGEIARLFDRFYRAGSDEVARERGMGLGLAICKGVVDAHGGRIWVESTPGRGSRFFFTIPPQPQDTSI